MAPVEVGLAVPKLRDVVHGARFVAVVSGRRVVVEVVYVRPRARFGDQRIMLRRADTGAMLPRARALSDLRSIVVAQ